MRCSCYDNADNCLIQMKKETKCIVDFEDTLLVSYKAYLTNLEVMIKGAACKSLSNRKRKAFEELNMPPQAFRVCGENSLNFVCSI